MYLSFDFPLFVLIYKFIWYMLWQYGIFILFIWSRQKHNFSVPASCPLIWFSPNLLLFSNRIVCFCFPINQKLNLNCSGVLPKLSGHCTFIYEITKVNINSKWSKKRFLFAPKPFFSQNKLVTRKLSKLPANIIYLRAKRHNIRE